jgi:hypothetical protein
VTKDDEREDLVKKRMLKWKKEEGERWGQGQKKKEVLFLMKSLV